MSTHASQLAQRLRKGVGAQGFSQAVNLFIRLAEVPLFLAFWDANRYGEWLMVATIPVYLAMADGGFTGSSQREMTMRAGAGDKVGALAVFQSTWVLLLIVSGLLLATAALATFMLPLAKWLALSTMPGSTLPAVILMLATHVALSFQVGLIYGGYCCEGRYARGTFLMSVASLLDFAGLAVAVIAGGGPIEAAAGYLLGRILGLLLLIYDLPSVAPWLSFGAKFASKVQVARLIRPSLASMAFPLGDALNIQGMRLVVGLVLGPTAVTVFSSIRTLCRSAMRPIIVIARLTEPEIALAYGAERHDVVRNLFTRSCQITVWTVLTACVALWFGGELLFRAWTGGKIAIEPQLYAWLLLASAVNGLWYTALMVPFSTNRHGTISMFYSLGYGIGVLALSAIFMQAFQLAGAGFAILIGELAMAIIVIPAALRLSGVSGPAWCATVAMSPLSLFLRAK